MRSQLEWSISTGSCSRMMFAVSVALEMVGVDLVDMVDMAYMVFMVDMVDMVDMVYMVDLVDMVIAVKMHLVIVDFTSFILAVDWFAFSSTFYNRMHLGSH